MAKERLQKILARAGLASRRKSEDLIRDGLVTINGKVAKLGDQADFQKDAIKVDGKILKTVEPTVYYAFYKPRAVISALSDPEGRPCIKDYLVKVNQRIYPCGRLDFNSEGLIILTNDGQFAEKYQKSKDITRVYHIKVKGHPLPEAIERLKRGAKIEHTMIKPHSVRLLGQLQNKSTIEMVFIGPATADLKLFFEEKGFLVEKMTRTSIGQLTLHDLKPGHYRILKQSQVEALVTQPELGMKAHEAVVKKAEKKIRPESAESRFIATRSPRSGIIDPRKAKLDVLEAKKLGILSTPAATARTRSQPRRQDEGSKFDKKPFSKKPFNKNIPKPRG